MSYSEIINLGLIFTAVAALFSKRSGVAMCAWGLVANRVLSCLASSALGDPSHLSWLTPIAYFVADMCTAGLMLLAPGRWAAMLAATFIPELIAHGNFIWDDNADRRIYWFTLYDVAWSQIALIWLWGSAEGLRRLSDPLWRVLARVAGRAKAVRIARALQKIDDSCDLPVKRRDFKTLRCMLRDGRTHDADRYLEAQLEKRR